VNDLKNGDARVNVIEAGLIKGFAGVPERVVHVDQDFAIFAGVRTLNVDATGEVLWNVRAAVNVVAEFKQLEAERFVKANRPQG
jgi:hypothetical protein